MKSGKTVIFHQPRADLPEDIIRELKQRKDVENITIGQKVGDNTRVVIPSLKI